jgi:DNA primase
MEGFFQEEIIDRIRDSTDMIDVLSDYVPLKKSGQNYKGLCPFHSEKTPSFVVSPSKQLYHCFGCGAGGDVFNFLVRYENISFPEAVRSLAKKAGINIEVKSKDPRLKTRRESLIIINREAGEHFRRNLKGTSGKTAREYLLKRGIREKTIEDFRLGFSLPAWEGLLTDLGKKGYSPEVLREAGLIVPRESGKGYYDRFRGRIIFPIQNIEGDIIGFGGRVMDDSLPKYINSPETPVYSKGENLYAFNKAKEYIRREGFLILVEGYMDAIALHQSGIPNTAATLGTALTKGHLKAISRFTKNVIVVFDADSAGQKAASMGLDIFLEGGIEAKIIPLPEGDDPDSFIRREGKDRFVNLLKEAPSLIDFNLRQILGSGAGVRTEDLNEKTRRLVEALVVISKIPNSIKRGFYIKKIAEETDIDEASLLEELKKLKGPKKVQSSQTSASSVEPFAVHSSQSRPKAEEILIHLMLKDKDLASEILDTLSPEDFTYTPFRIIVRAVRESLEKFKEVIPERLISNENDQEALSLLSELSLKEFEYEDLKKVMEDCFFQINLSEREKRLSEIQTRIREAERRGEEENVLALLSEKQRLAKSGYITHRKVRG